MVRKVVRIVKEKPERVGPNICDILKAHEIYKQNNLKKKEALDSNKR
jgi:hypothetical protein